jgi:predicted nucleic acid-binding protein
MPGITLDAGALIAVDRNDRRIAVLLARAGETRARITIPASALAQAIRRPERQVRLARLVRQPTTDVVDAHIVVCARRAHQRVVTSDPDDLCLLDPSLDVFTI